MITPKFKRRRRYRHTVYYSWSFKATERTLEFYSFNTQMTMLGTENMNSLYFVHIALFVYRIVGSSISTQQAPTAEVRNGTLKGLYSPQYEQDFFLGIPYAQPPLNNLRLNAPHSFKETVEYSPECVGYGVRLPYSGQYCYLSNTEKKSDDVGYNSSEDCLTLNVIRPAGVKANAELPVVVWIHGYVMSSALCNRMNTKFI